MIDLAEISEPIKVLSEDLVLVDWGPMTLTISAWDNERAMPVMAVRAAQTALESLEILADFQGYLKIPSSNLPIGRPLPRVVERAFEAARIVNGNLSPLAAVAGAVAEEVTVSASNLGADKVIVNNGGDIALYLKGRTRASVGLKALQSEELIGRLNLVAENAIGGVASSGWGGRSFSTGVADLVVVWADNAGLSDAAATYIAGQVEVRDKKVRRVRAKDIDPFSDLNQAMVTAKVGRLSPRQCSEALEQGALASQKLFEARTIRGCFIMVQGNTFTLDPDRILSFS